MRPSGLSVLLRCLIGALTLLWVYPAVMTVTHGIVRMDGEDKAKRTMPIDVANKKLDAIIARMEKAGNNYNPNQHFWDIQLLKDVRDHVIAYPPGGTMRADRVLQVLRARVLLKYTEDDLRITFGPLYEKLYPNRNGLTREDWAVLGHVLWTLALWYLYFCPIALLIFFRRSYEDSPDVAWTIAALLEQPIELLVAILFWPIGLKEYRPEVPLPERVQAVASAIQWLHSRRVVIPQRQPAELSKFLQQRMIRMPRLQSIGWVIRYIWAPITWEWRRLRHPIVLIQTYREAVYVTLVAITCIAVGDTHLALAASKEASSPLTGVIWEWNGASGGAPGSQSAFFLFKDNWEVDVFGMDKPNPGMEVSKLFPVKSRWKGTWLTGLFVDFDTTRINAYGSANFVAIQTGKAAVTLMAYVSRARDGTLRVSLPNTRITWPVSNKLGLGIGIAGSISQGQKPSILAGPIAKIQLTDKITILLRAIRDIFGRDRTIYGRADLSYAF